MISSIILDNIRSAHNVGSVFRTADAFAVPLIITVGITPHMVQESETRLPHVSAKATAAIAKTALGAEKTISNIHCTSIEEAISLARQSAQLIVALEQTAKSQKIQAFESIDDICLVLGHEVEGISKETLLLADTILEIPMLGKKESLNVSVAAGIAMYAMHSSSKDI